MEYGRFWLEWLAVVEVEQSGKILQEVDMGAIHLKSQISTKNLNLGSSLGSWPQL